MPPPEEETSAVADTAMHQSDTYSDEEIRYILGHLSFADKARIYAAAAYFSQRSGIERDDLAQQAFVRLMENGANRKYPIVGIICGIIRSIASGKDSNGKARLRYIDDIHLEPIIATAWVEGEATPEELLLAKMEQQRIKELLDDLFRTKPILAKLLLGKLNGLRGKALRIYVGLSEKELEANQKTLRRVLVKLEDNA